LTHIVATAAFAFLVLGAGIVSRLTDHGSESRRRRAAGAFVAYVLVVSFTPGLTRRDLWPFSGWPMMSVPPPEEVGPALPFSWIYGVTAEGAEYALDPRAVEPISMSELLSWLDYRSAGLSPEARNRFGRQLLQRVNESREAVRAGGRPGSRRGPLRWSAAPRHLLFATRWKAPEDVPDTPFTGLRWYRESWNIDDRLADPDVVTRTLGFEVEP